MEGSVGGKLLHNDVGLGKLDDVDKARWYLPGKDLVEVLTGATQGEQSWKC